MQPPPEHENQLDRHYRVLRAAIALKDALDDCEPDSAYDGLHVDKIIDNANAEIDALKEYRRLLREVNAVHRTPVN